MSLLCRILGFYRISLTKYKKKIYSKNWKHRSKNVRCISLLFRRKGGKKKMKNIHKKRRCLTLLGYPICEIFSSSKRRMSENVWLRRGRILWKQLSDEKSVLECQMWKILEFTCLIRNLNLKSPSQVFAQKKRIYYSASKKYTWIS